MSCESYLPKVRLPSGAAARPDRYGLLWRAQISRVSVRVLVGSGLSASAIKLQEACVLGILKGAEIGWMETIEQGNFNN